MTEATMEAQEESRDVMTTPPQSDAAALPRWFNEMQGKAWDDFRSLPMPHRKMESWRFASLKQLDFADFGEAPPLSEAGRAVIAGSHAGLEEVAGRIVFANGELVGEVFLDPELAARGVICLPLLDAIREHSDIVQEHFMTQQVELGGEKFAALHKARTKSGLFIHVPGNVEVEKPIEVVHWIDGAGATIFPHTLVVTGRNARVTVFEQLRSTSDTAPGFSCGVGDLFGGEGSKINYVSCQRWNRVTKAVQINTTVVGRDADVRHCQINLGTAWLRTEAVSHLLAPGGNSDMLSVSAPFGEMEVDQRTLQHHESPDTTSDLLYKNALHDEARTIFAGLIKVDPGAHQTDAYQTCRNLLLSDRCEANSMPGLEINADGVKCSHGSTSSRVSDEELFYLLARGIPAAAARKLIILGFVNEVVHRIQCDAIEEKVSRAVEEHFGMS